MTALQQAVVAVRRWSHDTGVYVADGGAVKSDAPLGLPAPSERPWTRTGGTGFSQYRTGVEPCARRPFDLYGEPQSES